MIRSFSLTHNYTSWHSTLHSEARHSWKQALNLPKTGPSYADKVKFSKKNVRSVFTPGTQYGIFTQKFNPLKKNPTVTQSEKHFWVRKNEDTLQENFNNLWVLNRLFIFDDWKDIALYLEELFQVKISLNPLFPDKAIIKATQGKFEDMIYSQVNGSIMENFIYYLKIE